MRVLAIALLGAVLFAACGSKHRSSSAPAPSGQAQTFVAGTWNGQIADNATSPPTHKALIFSLVHTTNGGPVTGTWRVGSTSGTVQGSVSGNVFSFTLVETSPCSGGYSGSATVSGSSMSGSFSGSDCGGALGGSFDATR